MFDDKKTEAESTPGGGVTENGSLATPINSASVNTLAQDVIGVKGKKVSPCHAYVNKEKATQYLRPAGNPISRTAQIPDGFIHSVTDVGSNVNMGQGDGSVWLDIEKTKTSRVFAAQFASFEAIANTLHSPQLNDIVTQNDPGVKGNSDTMDNQNAIATSGRFCCYSFSAEKESSTQRTLHAAVSTHKGANGELFLNSIISDSNEIVKEGTRGQFCCHMK